MKFLVHMEDIPLPHLLKFGPKRWKSIVTATCPKILRRPKGHLDSLGINMENLLPH